MGDLQHIDGPITDAGQEQLGVDGLFDIAGEQETLRAVAQIQHDRDVVDARTVVRRIQGNRAAQRPSGGDVRAVQPQPVAGREDAVEAVLVADLAKELAIPGTRPAHPGLGKTSDPISLEQERQARDVVLVRMSQHDHVKSPIPWRKPRIEDLEEAIRIRAAIDKDPSAARSFEQDRVALPDVQHGHRQTRATGVGERRNDEREDRQRRGDSQCCSDGPCRTALRLA
jgi:hypothetical protein